MKKLINFFKKLFGCKQVCPKCKEDPCKCETEVPEECKKEAVTEKKVMLDCSKENAIPVTEFTTTDKVNYDLESDKIKPYEVPDAKWECVSTATIDASKSNQEELKTESAPKKKRVRKKKAVTVAEPENSCSAEVSEPVEVPTEKPVEPKKKRATKKKKTESK